MLDAAERPGLGRSSVGPEHVLHSLDQGGLAGTTGSVQHEQGPLVRVPQHRIPEGPL